MLNITSMNSFLKIRLVLALKSNIFLITVQFHLYSVVNTRRPIVHSSMV